MSDRDIILRGYSKTTGEFEITRGELKEMMHRQQVRPLDELTPLGLMIREQRIRIQLERLRDYGGGAD